MIDTCGRHITYLDKLTKEDLIRLEEGGLCRMCKTCHFPTCTFGRY